MTPFPATDYRLHVWWARRPLVASRAAVLASLLPADADREKFLHMLGIHGDPVATRHKNRIAARRIERANDSRSQGVQLSLGRSAIRPEHQDDRNWLAGRPRMVLWTASRFSTPLREEEVFPSSATRVGDRSYQGKRSQSGVDSLDRCGQPLEWPSSFGGTEVTPEFERLSETSFLQKS